MTAEIIQTNPLVLDNGTGFTKNGFAGEDQPRSVFPTIIGYPKHPVIMPDVEGWIREFYIGYFLAYSSANNLHMECTRTAILSMPRCFLMFSISSTRIPIVTGLSKSFKGSNDNQVPIRLLIGSTITGK